LTRRDLLVRTGGAYLALIAAGHAAVAHAAVDDAAALSASRQATYAALLAAIALDPGSGLAAAQAPVIADRFREHYLTAREPLRAYADDTLDRIEAGGFSSLRPEAALETLRAWTAAGAPDDVAPDPRRALAGSGLTLASLTFEEDELRQVGYVLEAA
jgi:hypothetical protein